VGEQRFVLKVDAVGAADDRLRPLRAEPLGPPFALVSRSRPLVASRHSSDEPDGPDVTKEATVHDEPNSTSAGEMLAEVLDLVTGLGVLLLPLSILAIPCLVLLLPLAVPLIPLALLAPPYLLIRAARGRLRSEAEPSPSR
jgi:hypothetical protein